MHAIVNDVLNLLRYDEESLERLFKVYGVAMLIARDQDLTEEEWEDLEILIALHDLGQPVHRRGIPDNHERKAVEYAKPIMVKRKFPQERIDRIVNYMERHHRTFRAIEPPLYILIEADYIVEIMEKKLSPAAIRIIRRNAFHTQTGKKILASLFEIEKTPHKRQRRKSNETEIPPLV